MRTWGPAVLLCVALAGCSGGDPTATPTQLPAAPSAPETSEPPPTPEPTTAAPTRKATPKPPTVTATPPTDLADGKHYAYLKSFDTTKRVLTFDVVQFLTGEAAEKAAAEDGKEAYDYYIRNVNAQLRTLSFLVSTTVVVNTLAAGETGSSSQDTRITHAKLASYFASGEAQARLFFLTLVEGVIDEIHEQYLP